MCIVWQDEKGKFTTHRILLLPTLKTKAYFNDCGCVFWIPRILIIWSANAQSFKSSHDFALYHEVFTDLPDFLPLASLLPCHQFCTPHPCTRWHQLDVSDSQRAWKCWVLVIHSKKKHLTMTFGRPWRCAGEMECREDWASSGSPTDMQLRASGVTQLPGQVIRTSPSTPPRA